MPRRFISISVFTCALVFIAQPARAQDHARRIKRVKRGHRSGQADKDRYRIVLPPGFSVENRLTPVVYALHGYSGNMDSMEHVWKAACAEVGAVLVVGQGTKSLGPGSYSWSGFEDAGKMIDAARVELRKRHKLHRFAPRVLTGMSQGAWATYSLGMRYPKTYRRLIPVVGMFRARSYETAQPLTDTEKTVMKRWKVYMMVGVQDKQELVANNRWLANQLERLGASIKAPFVDRTDPSWSLYQDIGHAFPGGAAKDRTAELVRALKFVLQPDEIDRRNWGRVDPDWRKKATWLDEDRMAGKAKDHKSKRSKRRRDQRHGD
ncbi:MAG: alpha/beta hydrolase [Phycisphaerae bacterium]